MKNKLDYKCIYLSVPTDWKSAPYGLRVRSRRTDGLHESNRWLASFPFCSENKEFENIPNILTFLLQTLMYRPFERVRDNRFSLTSP